MKFMILETNPPDPQSDKVDIYLSKSTLHSTVTEFLLVHGEIPTRESRVIKIAEPRLYPGNQLGGHVMVRAGKMRWQAEARAGAAMNVSRECIHYRRAANPPKLLYLMSLMYPPPPPYTLSL